MRLLLDTHVFLWWCTASPRLRRSTRRVVADAEEVYVSAASAWEAAIKMSIGKLRMKGGFEDAVDLARFAKLPVTMQHAALLVELPPHHTDRFDRMLVAQARAEALTLMTHDRRFEPYDVHIIWA